MAVVVRLTDADHRDLRVDRLEERRERRRGAVVRHLQQLGVQRHLPVQQQLLRRLLRFAAHQDRVLAVV